MTTLASLTPATVGTAAAEALQRHVGRLVVPLAPGVRLTLDPPQGDTDISLTVASLCAWAQTGELGDWTDHEDAADALLTASDALYASPLRPWQGGDLEAMGDAVALARDESPDPVRLVLACALSRLRVCRGEPVTVSELARLAGVTDGRARQLVTAGELRATAGTGTAPSTVTAREARRWLAARGLRGW